VEGKQCQADDRESTSSHALSATPLKMEFATGSSYETVHTGMLTAGSTGEPFGYAYLGIVYSWLDASLHASPHGQRGKLCANEKSCVDRCNVTFYCTRCATSSLCHATISTALVVPHSGPLYLVPLGTRFHRIRVVYKRHAKWTAVNMFLRRPPRLLLHMLCGVRAGRHHYVVTTLPSNCNHKTEFTYWIPGANGTYATSYRHAVSNVRYAIFYMWSIHCALPAGR